MSQYGPAIPRRQAGIVVDVTITKQAANPNSTLRRFLAVHLPHCECVVDSWSQTLSTSQPTELPVTTSSNVLGIGLELRIGLDLADTPAPWKWLSYLPPDRCLALINAAGFQHTPVGQLPPSGTTDPVLLHWTRAEQPQTLNNPEQWQALASCLDLASIEDLIHKHAHDQTVDERRSWFLRITDDDHHTTTEAHTQALGHAWNAYLHEGRSALAALGRPVVVAPEFAGGFGRGDLVLGHTLVDIKTGTASQEKLEEWLAQLLGYVLLDYENTLKLETIAAYCGWQPTLLTYPIAELLDHASAGPTPTLAALRDDFHAAIQPEVDGFAAWRLRQRSQTRRQATS